MAYSELLKRETGQSHSRNKFMDYYRKIDKEQTDKERAAKLAEKFNRQGGLNLPEYYNAGMGMAQPLQHREHVRSPLGQMKKGGEIKKTGIYKLHKGEIVVPANRVKSVENALKKSKMKPLKK